MAINSRILFNPYFHPAASVPCQMVITNHLQYCNSLYNHILGALGIGIAARRGGCNRLETSPRPLLQYISRKLSESYDVDIGFPFNFFFGISAPVFHLARLLCGLKL